MSALLPCMQPTDYQRWSAAPRNMDYTEDEAVCLEYLPQQPKTWNPFACVSVPLTMLLLSLGEPSLTCESQTSELYNRPSRPGLQHH